ncbi:hypothetical protein BCR34DRAFT_608996 [Clohesyomyces aquaticus]|uniref:Uncharacterized protein n=1 Tax=Clohesyomyces aquaticus TaxID=1231657 RepID=A0A1Y1Y0H6_9PLEO|nr:hypothetical protein BCR34DRAFT_608996 [Clohesyomyces aquaticus]
MAVTLCEAYCNEMGYTATTPTLKSMTPNIIALSSPFAEIMYPTEGVPREHDPIEYDQSEHNNGTHSVTEHDYNQQNAPRKGITEHGDGYKGPAPKVHPVAISMILYACSR